MMLEQVVIDPANPSPDFVEDLARYHFASRFVARRNVLDVACGSGYGSSILLSEGKASSVLGVDASLGVIPHIRRFTSEGLHFVIVRGNALPFPNASFEAVVSLETIEHLHDPLAFLAEVRRILCSDGVLVVSTPLNNSELRFHPANPYHIREYSESEFHDLLRQFFAKVQLYSQITQFDYEPICALERTPLGARLRRVVAEILPRTARCTIRSLLGSKGWHRVGSEIIPGCHQHAGYQLAVCR
jgi:SAM-dependent methyltransferase